MCYLWLQFTLKICYSRLQKSCNKQVNSGKPQLCLNREVGHAAAGKIIIFICGKSIVVFHCFSLLVARLLQDFCNLLYHCKTIKQNACYLINNHNGPAYLHYQCSNQNLLAHWYYSGFMTPCNAHSAHSVES